MMHRSPAMAAFETPLRVSAVMPVKDRFDMALIALTRLVEQTVPPCEIVIVDDGSLVPFEGQIGPIRVAAAGRRISVRMVRNESATGVSAARNRGVAEAAGELVCFCDSDDYWSPEKLSIVLEIIRANPAIDVLFHAFRWDHRTLPILKWLPSDRVIDLPRWLMVSFSFLNASCLCMRKAVYQSGFREDMKHYEDQEFFLRISLNRRIWFINRTLMEMGRPPGSPGGASHDAISMRRGALVALAHYTGPTPVGVLAYFKLGYHRARMVIDALRARSTANVP